MTWEQLVLTKGLAVLLAALMSLVALPSITLDAVITFPIFMLPQVASVSSVVFFFSVSCFKTSCCITLQRLPCVRGE